MTAYSYFFGAVSMGLGSLYYVGTHDYSVFAIPKDVRLDIFYPFRVVIVLFQSIYALIYAVFITSAMCYMLITWSNVHLSATIVTAFWPTQVKQE